MAPLCGIVALFSYWGLSIWLGELFASKAWPIVAVLAIGIFFNSVAAVPFAKIQAAGYSKVTAIFHCIEAIIYLGGLFFLAREFGLVGAAIAWTLRVIGDFGLLIFYAENQDA